MAPSALILLTNGTEEIEFVTAYDILVRAGFDVKSCGVGLDGAESAHCTRNVRILPDTIDLPNKPTTDILILPGGASGAKFFASDPAVQHLIRTYRDAGRYTAFICAATIALVASVQGGGKTEGLESTKPVEKVTSHPAFKEEVVKAGWNYAGDEERVVVSGKTITSRGPGTAMLFALTLVEALAGKDKRDEITGPLVAAERL